MATVWGFLFELDRAPVHKTKSIKKWFVKFGEKEQSPDLNPIKHLWDELEQARPDHPARLPTATTALAVEEAKPTVTFRP